MTLPQPKMPRLHARLLFLLLLFLLQPQPSKAAATPKPKSQAFWRKFCGFFCPSQLSCDSEVYLSPRQQLELLQSQEFLDILELFPQILLENEKLQHTPLVRLEDHQRDLILLRYKDFFHPQETLPLARHKVVSQLTMNQQGFDREPIAEPPPYQNHEQNEIHLTEDQVQELLQKSTHLNTGNNHGHQNALPEDEILGTPNWNEAEGFIRDYVNKQRLQQSMENHLQEAELPPQASGNQARGKAAPKTITRKDKPIALNINQLQDHAAHLHVDQILKELEKMGHSFDLDDLASDPDGDSRDVPQSQPELHRTIDSNPTVLSQDPPPGGKSSLNSNCRNPAHRKRLRAKHVNRITPKKSQNSKEPYSDSRAKGTAQGYSYRHQTNLPSEQASEFLNSPLSSESHGAQRRTGKKRTSGSESSSGQRGHRRRQRLSPAQFVHEPGGEDKQAGRHQGDAGSQEVAKRHSRRKREVFSLQVCPVVETWSNIVLAETANGTLVQIAQFPEVNLEQWFLEERCLYEESQIIQGVTCEIRERLVDAVVIPVVDPSQPIQRTKIKVDCCMSMFNIDLGY
ncbi:uncharacterized protein LOC110981465 [Acanthaster planci]|uniref:Uncharacterized protein LOC110981465 n=1 Tax=Acanthaster planci TaxID=133434 RepID=A0A8B7YTS2_ACAPL|nr:uncharacterized protein LOC110981465 [Acanthaster planci]